MESSPQPPETSRFNLSEWALNHQTLMLFFIVVLAIFGTTSYYRLGQAEDPAFTFRVMVVNVFWPGATAREMEQQVTDRIEKKLQETPGLNYLRSFSKPGEAFIFVSLKDSVDPKTVPNSWYQVRKKIGDIRQSLPEGVIGPFYNDEFGDTYGSIYAFTSDGFSHAELKKKVDFARQVLLRVPDVAKVDLVGVQDEKVFVEMSDTKLATLGLNPQLIIQTLQQQNVMTAAGNVSTQDDRVFLRVTGEFQTLEHIKNIGIRANSRTFRLGDIATITKGYADPPSVRFRYKGQEAIGLAVSMRQGGDIIALGKNLQAEIDRVRKDLPIGVDIHQVSDQPKVVAASVQEFVKTLNEALIIVLVVSFLSLGFRTGTVVALSIPLVLAFVYIAMWVTGIDLQKISLGALIIALGLLVDDAIIAVEMMALKLEQGWDKMRAATYAYTTTAFPMLTGTLITAAGFLPVGLAKSAAGEYTFSIFAVVSIALLASWVVAVMFTPYLGYKLLKLHKVEHEDANAVYRRGFYVPFRKMVTWCVRYRWVVIVLTALAFVGSLGAFKFVQQQFFPNASRPELIVDLWLPEGSSWQSTEREAKRLEAVLKADPDIENYVAYLGGGSPRFVLVLDQQMPNVNLSEFVIVTKDLKAREAVFKRLNTLFATDFANVRGRVTRLPNGPPVGYPVQFRVSGEDPTKLRELVE